jgi:hypothetical protein
MTLTITIPPDVEQALAEQARRAGQSVPELAAALLTRAARLAALERIGSYDTRARAGLPPLSDEAVSRDSMYEGRGL